MSVTVEVVGHVLNGGWQSSPNWAGHEFCRDTAVVTVSRVKITLVDLPDQVDTEAVMWLLRSQNEPPLQIEVASGDQRVVGPQPHSLIADLLGERHAGVHQSSPQTVTAALGAHQQDPQLGRLLVLGNAEDTAHPDAVKLGDPSRFSLRVVLGGVPGDALATSASKVTSQPNSWSYSSPWAITTQPRSPGRSSGRMTVRAFSASPMLAPPSPTDTTVSVVSH